MLELIQNADVGMLHRLSDTLRCPALDFIMPKITALGSGGAVWLAAGLCGSRRGPP